MRKFLAYVSYIFHQVAFNKTGLLIIFKQCRLLSKL
jgi:hypothetical protein